jgi:plastocyanin
VSPRLRVPAGVAAGVLAALAVGTACFSEHRVDVTGLPAECQSLVSALSLPAGSVIVGIQNFGFTPASVSVAKGTTVTWVNCEGEPALGHTVTADDKSWTSPVFTRGKTYTRTFTASGTVGYHCEPHPFMKAAVVVQ